MDEKHCKICGRKAVYAYYSVLACPPCKVFFRRNALNGLVRTTFLFLKDVCFVFFLSLQQKLKCSWNSNCEINENNVRICSYCRLKKCFSMGMKSEMIRGPLSKQIQTKNLLQSDNSTLTIDQWNKISNLSHCYDEYSGLLIGERFVRQQNALPLKLRLKNTALIDFTGMALNGLQLFYERNQDFVSLSANDRSCLLSNTFKHAGGVCTNFLLHKVGITDYPMYYDAIGKIANPLAAIAAKRLSTQLDFDMIIVKLLLAVLSFSTINFTTYSMNTSSKYLSNIKQVLHIQNTYIELIWRYLLYKYDFKRSVLYFSRLLQCLLTVNEVIVKIEEVQWYTNQTDTLVQQTEQALNLNN